MIDPDLIDDTIREADLSEICHPQTGDCVSVAVAIQEVFGGEFVCGYQTPTDLRPAHATVDIDGILYDGNGSTSVEALYDVATSGLKESERQDFDAHIGEVSDLTNNALYDEQTKNQVKDRLLDYLDSASGFEP